VKIQTTEGEIVWASFEVTAPEALEAMITQTDLHTAVNLDLFVQGGVAPYTYSWNTSPAQTTQTASNLGVGTYYLTVSDSLGCVTNSSVSISLESVKSIDFTKAVQVYPNPTNGIVYLNISNELGNNANVQVTSIDGKVVYNATNMSTSTINKIDFSSLKSGLYFVKITSGNNSGVIKINKL
jgi:hypothetical protein